MVTAIAGRQRCHVLAGASRMIFPLHQRPDPGIAQVHIAGRVWRLPRRHAQQAFLLPLPARTPAAVDRQVAQRPPRVPLGIPSNRRQSAM
jgi:hypothetical protein